MLALCGVAQGSTIGLALKRLILLCFLSTDTKLICIVQGVCEQNQIKDCGFGHTGTCDYYYYYDVLKL